MTNKSQTATRVTVKTDTPIGEAFTVEYFDGGAWKSEPIEYPKLAPAVERAKGITVGVYVPGEHDGREVAWAAWM
jgi:hypothetical protein